MYKAFAGILLAATATVPAHAAFVVVQAQANSTGGGTGVSIGQLVAGQTFSITSSTDDLWSAGPPFRISDANGLTGVRFASATDDSGQPVGTQIGGDYGVLQIGNLTTAYGSLVGRIGSNYQLLGANYNGPAWATGNLELFYWDSNNFDNFGEITFNVTGIPEPTTWALLILGFGVVGAGLRGQRKQRAVPSFA